MNFVGPAFFNPAAAPSGPGPGFLDAYVFDEVVASLRRRIYAYSGPILRVQNGSTLVETDIYSNLTSGALDSAALASALGAANGNLSRLYYQDGSGNYLAPGTAKPNIYTAGALRPAGILLDGTNHWLVSNVNCSSVSCFSIFVLGTRTAAGDGLQHSLVENYNGSSLNCTALFYSESGNYTGLFVGDGSASVQTQTASDIGSMQVLAAIANRAQAVAGNKSKLYLNGSFVTQTPTASGTVGTSSVNTAAPWQVGSRGAGASFRWKGSIHSVVISKSDLSADVAAVSTVLAVT